MSKVIKNQKTHEKKWSSPEGELAVDVYQTDKEIVIRSAVAGIRSEELDISIEDDVLVIRGKREKPAEEEGANHFIRECYWEASQEES